jgi:putative phosphoribosyl transferase
MLWGDCLFADRREAGRLLAKKLEAYRSPEVVVLGIPRGGVVVAAEVAAHLGAELDVVVARKLGAPGAPELAIGAVTADGERYLNTTLIRELGISDTYIEAAAATQSTEAQRRERLFRGTRKPALIAGRTVLIVDDGLATGATMRAAIRSVRRAGPGKVVVALPVGAADTCASLRAEVDAVVCVHELALLFAIGNHYVRFEPVEDAEVKRILDTERGHSAAEPSGRPLNAA